MATAWSPANIGEKRSRTPGRADATDERPTSAASPKNCSVFCWFFLNVMKFEVVLSREGVGEEVGRVERGGACARKVNEQTLASVKRTGEGFFFRSLSLDVERRRKKSPSHLERHVHRLEQAPGRDAQHERAQQGLEEEGRIVLRGRGGGEDLDLKLVFLFCFFRFSTFWMSTVRRRGLFSVSMSLPSPPAQKQP